MGELVLARVVGTDAGQPVVDRTDCIAIERLVLTGYALEIPTSPCAPEYAAYCEIAKTASARGP